MNTSSHVLMLFICIDKMLYKTSLNKETDFNSQMMINNTKPVGSHTNVLSEQYS